MFDKLIGQSKVKSRLTFYRNAKMSRGRIPPILFNGAKGLGKTAFAKEFAYSLGNPLMEINSATIRNDEQFMEQVPASLTAAAPPPFLGAVRLSALF